MRGAFEKVKEEMQKGVERALRPVLHAASDMESYSEVKQVSAPLESGSLLMGCSHDMCPHCDLSTTGPCIS